MKLPDALMFASDAEVLALTGAVFVALALGCTLMERRRMRRAALDRTGWVPWTGLFLVFAVVGGGLLSLGVPAWMHGG